MSDARGKQREPLQDEESVHLVVSREDFYPNTSGRSHTRWLLAKKAAQCGWDVARTAVNRKDKSNMKGLVTVDVEGGTDPNTYHSVNMLEQLLDEIEIPATLFVTPDVVENRPETVGKWLDQPHSVGLHIHPERIRPGDSEWLTEYDENAIEKMVAIGCDIFTDYLDFEPSLFRAGRWEYSEQLLRALESQGFERDASLRPDIYCEPYKKSGVEEIPMTVYDSALVRQLLRPSTLNSIPLHADTFLGSYIFIPGFYAVTWRLLQSDIPYLMTSLHDYDVESVKMRSRFKQYFSYLSPRVSFITINSI